MLFPATKALRHKGTPSLKCSNIDLFESWCLGVLVANSFYIPFKNMIIVKWIFAKKNVGL
jgi:hypothetical protein